MDMTVKELQTVKLTMQYFKGRGFWKKEVKEQEIHMGLYLHDLMNVWGVKVNLVLKFDDSVNNAMTSGGNFQPHTNTIFLYKASLMTALHEFKHVIRCAYPMYNKGVIEEDAVSWSHTVFYLAMPRLYQQSLDKGYFMHLLDTPYFTLNASDIV